VGVVIGKDGTELFAQAAGKRGYGSSDPMTLDSIFWIASCTKMITGVACMQLVEQGKLSLDDPAQVESLCPELKDVKVLQSDGSLVAKKTGISLRMLLTHTCMCALWRSSHRPVLIENPAGLGYTFFHEGLRDHGKPIGFDEFSGHLSDMIQPLVHQPGEGWQYGVTLRPIKRLHRKVLIWDAAWHRLGWFLPRARDQTVVERLLSAAHILASRFEEH